MLTTLRTGRWSALGRIVVVVFLALIVLDFWDTSCDVMVPGPSGPVLSTDAANGTDACAGSCVPDCFCCSNPSPAVHLALTEMPGTPSGAPTAPIGLCVPGHLPVLEHIPITTL